MGRKSTADAVGGMNMIELKPCPFCGGEANIKRMNINSRIYTVGCNNARCIASLGHLFFGFVDKRKVADAWNRRKEEE